jgi:hypothetical protein
MSERDDEESPAVDPAAQDDAAGGTPTGEASPEPPERHVAPDPDVREKLADLAPTALQAGNPSAIHDIAKTITALNRPPLLPPADWQRQFTPAFNLPKIDFPTFDVGRQFDVSGYDFPARTREVMGIDFMGGRAIGDTYLRGIGDVGASGAFTRPAIEAIGVHQGLGISAAARDLLGGQAGFSACDLLGGTAFGPDYGHHFRDIATGPISFSRWLDASVPRVDMSAWSDVIGTASAVSTSMHRAISAAARAMFDVGTKYQAFSHLINPALRSVHSALDEINRLAPIMQPAAALWSNQITDLMHGWSVLSDFGHRLAGRALHLAVLTRDALINDTDRAAVREIVINFMRHVLGYTRYPTEARVEAVTSALLDDAWLPVGTPLEEDYSPREQLRALAKCQHSLWLPLTDTKRRGHLIASLEEPDHIATSDYDDAPSRPMDRLRATEFTSEQQPITHPVLKRLLDPLTPVEREIVWAKHHDGARTWADAATMCGRPTSEGETVRRKVLKLKNAELQRRSA